MIKLNEEWLTEVGLAALPAEHGTAFLRHTYETLEMRVGMALADRMPNEQLDEFEVFIDANDEPGALAWLEGNFPDYGDVVRRHFAALSEEVRAEAPRLLATLQVKQAS
ncbi:MAG: DUF5663 domain-containing protein [Acidimicrobiales bacterium]|nr:DUF5663 domain-containing protein [Acidimicrobiales bacterium]